MGTSGISLYHQGLLLVGDRDKGNIVINLPKAGDNLQTVKLTEITGWTDGLHLNNDTLLIHHTGGLSSCLVSITHVLISYLLLA